MTPPQILAAMLVLAAALGVAGIRGGWLKLPRRRVKYDDLDAQIAADFAPGEREEARALIDSVLVHTRPGDEKLAWRSLLDGCRGNIAKLRRATPKSIEALHKIYRLFGDSGATTTDTE